MHQDDVSKRLTCLFSERKRLRDLQYDSDFNDNDKQTAFYRERADLVDNLINSGLEFLPNF